MTTFNQPIGRPDWSDTTSTDTTAGAGVLGGFGLTGAKSWGPIYIGRCDAIRFYGTSQTAAKRYRITVRWGDPLGPATDLAQKSDYVWTPAIGLDVIIPARGTFMWGEVEASDYVGSPFATVQWSTVHGLQSVERQNTGKILANIPIATVAPSTFLTAPLAAVTEGPAMCFMYANSFNQGTVQLDYDDLAATVLTAAMTSVLNVPGITALWSIPRRPCTLKVFNPLAAAQGMGATLVGM